MAWARYDDELALNRKVALLRSKGVDGIAALGLHLLANTWSRHEGTNGLVPAYIPEQLAGRPGERLAALLTEVGMFDPDGDGWAIHDFCHYSDPKDDGRSASAKRRDLSVARAEAGSRGGRSKALANALANDRFATSNGQASG